MTRSKSWIKISRILLEMSCILTGFNQSTAIWYKFIGVCLLAIIVSTINDIA